MTWSRRASLVLPVLLIAAGLLWIVRGGGAQGPVELTGRGAHYTVRLELEPGTGPREVRIGVEPRAAEVSVFAVMPHMGHTTPELAAPRDGTGRHVARGELFTMAGAWELGIRVRGTPGTEVITVRTLVGKGE
ncbi:unnamed protein product [[Actinomadura] parvosata subsp. kistnae]|uniref:YtkA-like domain-containing protein n=1 Tax=[Actinomadura] parvosata subsp. kistnae TaxID=1909395 RepID=A0A1U9ZX01_9ACTN|nr:hypothetical protein [Nonomuraea sp. ATCC 55076]AQZ62485.1 hypothetical protein BKM31_14350 [Nonomuraea sp. ATCC 55076]SPL88726.1 unnamed protein product [Actinomadura parvosata subsp. kistnae]